MHLSERMLLRGLRKHLPAGASVQAVETGLSDALGPMQKTTVVLTTDEILLATPVRTRTLLTRIRRADIEMIETVGSAAAVTFDDYDRAVRRTVRLDLSSFGDRAADLIEAMRQPPAPPVGTT